MKTLFDKTKIGTMELKNRLIRAAAGDRYAIKGHMTEKDLQVYEEIAKGGVGTIITGYTYILDSDIPSAGSFGIYDDSFISEYKKLTDVVHEYDAKIILQLVHYGSHASGEIGNKKVLAPSAVALEYRGVEIMPEEMSKEDIKHIQKAFAEAAIRAKKAGFDGVELHSAHGFLLNQFLTPYYNRRTDEYGGTIENRARMVLETYSEVREAVGNEYPIFVKINCMDGIEQGITYEGLSYTCKELTNKGINAIEISGAWYQLFNSKDEFYFKEYTEKIAAENNVPVILVGGNRNFDSMSNILNDTSIEYFAMCRPLISEPDLVKRWEGGETSKTKCVSCNGCLGKGKCILNKN